MTWAEAAVAWCVLCLGIALGVGIGAAIPEEPNRKANLYEVEGAHLWVEQDGGECSVLRGRRWVPCRPDYWSPPRPPSRVCEVIRENVWYTQKCSAPRR